MALGISFGPIARLQKEARGKVLPNYLLDVDVLQELPNPSLIEVLKGV